jgi:outer membrane protein W
MRANLILLAAIAALLISIPELTSAKGIELTPYAGYRSSGALNSTTVTLDDGTMLENFDFESGAIFGLWFNFRVDNRLKIELNVEGFPSKVQGTDTSTKQKTDAFDVVLYYLQIGLHYEIIEYGVSAEDVKIRPFVYAGLGSTIFDPAGDRSSNAKFNAAFAVGFKFMFNDRLGLRTQGRYMWTYMNASNDYFCTGDGTGYGEQCTIFPTSESLSQIDLTLGLIITL